MQGPRQAPRKKRVFLRYASLAAIAAVGLVTWYVLVPASKVSSVNLDGVPDDAVPRMAATVIRDLPMTCHAIATGSDKNAGGKRLHRNHAYITRHQGTYFAMFSEWRGKEDQPGGVVRYATSQDGEVWSKAKTLASPEEGHGVIARGFVERDGRLFAWYATHTGDTFFRNGQAENDQADRNIALLEAEWLGEEIGWVFQGEVLAGYLNNYAPRFVDGEASMALRDQDRATFLATSTDGGQNWQVGDPMPVPPFPQFGEPGLALPDEPVVVGHDDDGLRVLLRNNNTFDGRLWSTAIEDGKWMDPHPLDFPADASKFVPFDLADGTHAMVGNFEPEVRRALLHLATSSDGGVTYDRLYRLVPDNQYEGFAWRSPQYPHALIDSDTMRLAFSYSKRDITICSAPANAQAIEAQSGFSLVPRLFKGLCNKDLPRYLRHAAGYAGCREHFVWG